MTSMGKGIEILSTIRPEGQGIVSPAAMDFVALLERKFGQQRRKLLQLRQQRQQRLDAGEFPDFLPETKAVREGHWTIGPLPEDLKDRRVEITGPVDRKMVINALNSGARVFMADLEDATCPTWDNVVVGQRNLYDAVRRDIRVKDPKSGKLYQLNEKIATLLVRPRGWHMDEAHVRVDGMPISASLFDFGLYFFHNAKATLERKTGPYYYLPKLESHLEARLWNEVFGEAEKQLGVPHGSIKATVLIETILTAFEMDEILYELKDHSAGLNCGRWDYIFSIIKKLRAHPQCVVPDRAQITMTSPNMRAYSLLAIQTCHRRGAPCIGGMAAQIPVKNNDAANQEAFEKVRIDKEREANDGHDGTWVAHPGLIAVATKAFDAVMKNPNQIDKQLPQVSVSAQDLLEIPKGDITEKGVRMNVQVGVRYVEAWLNGIGCVPLFNLMEDAATAEISRSQLWQWARHQSSTKEGQVIDFEWVAQVIEEEVEAIQRERGGTLDARLQQAGSLFKTMAVSKDMPDFLSLPAYEILVKEGR